MKKTIVLLSILSLSAVAQEGPNDKKQMPQPSLINPVIKPVLDKMKVDCENGFVCRLGLSAFRSSVMLAADVAKTPALYEFILQEPHPRSVQRSSHHNNQENK